MTKPIEEMNLEELIDHYERVEKLIREKLPEGGNECNCKVFTTEAPRSITLIHRGSMFNEIEELCLKCGGLRLG